ncbi:hypothetical protein KUF57_25460 [Mycolicibacterium sp. PAM1]|uniref:hypothetical protein n=1 Tax=Mycolicibacterium sp. PAM1 TaxID=2853535 RepID=UPI001C3C29FD|nr:hypothetical protein [Mycolicibacterium sp. PAM1]MBV5246882.1 hypothetical protein [Mycolicibacterium sp. PAM1]
MVSNAKKTALSNYFNTAVDAIVGLIVNPIFLAALGTTNFGVWKAIQRVLAVGSTANGGAIQSLKWVIAHRSKSSTDDEKRRDVGAALTVLFYWSPILIAVTAVIVALLPELMRDVPHGDMAMVYLTGSILGLNIVLMNLAAVPNSVLVGVNQGFRSMNITTAVFVVTNVGMVAAAMLGLGPVGMAAAMTAGTAINGVLTFVVLRKRVSWWGVAKPSRGDISRLSKFSGWVLAWSFVIRLSLATEVIVLSAFAGVEFVSSYTFTSYVVLFGLAICQLTTSSMMPKLGSLIGNEEWLEAQAVTREARELTIALATGMGSLVILLNEPFVEIWAGEQQFMGQGVNVLMVIAFVQFAIFRTDAQIQDTGLDIGKKVALGAVMTALAIVAGGVAFLISHSIEMMFLAIIITRISGSIGFPILANRVARSRSWPVGRTAMGVLILMVSISSAPFLQAHNLIQLIGFAAVAVLILAPTIFYTTLSTSTRKKLLSR